MEEIKAYKPKCCKKAYLYKSSAFRHENKCFKNPDNKACVSCDNFVTAYNTVYVPPHGDQNYGNADYDERYNYCNYDGVIIGTDLQKNGHKPFQFNCPHWKLNSEVM
ncbi:hypothetical protein [Lachnoclostridium sp.]|uniref:hypothetical protein n=1 Tax=Lachnoclostridium sp. TaxID=2028282 RepID=UPI00289925B7|nr:hypothetical protein [Lachnoclostridium sp.]